MSEVYRTAGLSFRYPSGWSVSEQSDDDRLTVTLEGGGTAFCALTLLYDRPDPELVLDAAAQAFREEYPEADVYPSAGTLAARPAAGRDVDFICLETCNTALLRAVRTGRFTLLLMFQSSDPELDESRPVFDEVCRSLDCDSGILLDGLR
jgi:hypothetical protein